MRWGRREGEDEDFEYVGGKVKTKSTLAYFDFRDIYPEVNLLHCRCCHGVRFLHLLRTVLYKRRELKAQDEIAAVPNEPRNDRNK